MITTVTEGKVKFKEDNPINSDAELIRKTAEFINTRPEELNNKTMHGLISDYIRYLYKIPNNND